MKEARELYQLTIRTKSTCPMRDQILDLIDRTEDGDVVKVKSVIASEKEDGKYMLCIDADSIDNVYGMIKKAVKEDGDELDEALMDQLIVDGNYEISIHARNGNVITGTLAVTKPEVSASGESDLKISKKLQEIVDEKIAAGIVEKEDMDERIRVMKENHVDEFLMTRVIKGYRKYTKAVRRPNCIYVDPFLESSLKKHEEPIISEILRSAVSRNGIIFEGEKSVGKNVCATTVAWLLGMPERLFTCSRQMTTSTLYGEKTTDNSAMQALKAGNALDFARAKVYAARNGGVDDGIIEEAAKFELMKAQAAATNIVIEDSELCDWLIDGGILILNEMNLCEPNLLASFLNPILDGTGYLTVQGRGEIPVNKDCVLIGTQNVDYAGCEEQNEATMSRLACERFRQPESISGLLVNSVKAKMAEDGFEDIKIDMKYIKQADSFYSACRTSVEEGLISNAALNIRGFVRAISAVLESDGHCRLARQIELNVVNTCPITEAESLRGTLKSRITL